MANPASIRLGTTGKAQVKADLTEIGATGTASFKSIGDAGDVQAKRWSKSYESAGRDVEAALERQRLAAAKIAAIMPQTAVQMQVNAAAGSNTRFGGGYAASGNERQTSSEGTARQSAMFFAELSAEEERLAARTRALVSAIDPAFVAQERFNREMGEARALISAGAISLDQYVAKLSLEQSALAAATGSQDDHTAAQDRLEKRTRALVSAIDPAFAAQDRFNREIAEARTLVSAGTLSLDQYVVKLRLEQEALDAASGAHMRGGNSAGAQRAAMQGLSYQLQDTFTQISMGTNVLQVFAIQGGQVAGQFSNLEGKAGNFARFMIGPWGLAITAAMLVLGPLVGKLINANSAIDDGVDKLKKDATETENTRKAKERFAKTAEGVAAAIRESTAATLKGIEADRSAAEQANINAKRNLVEEIAIRRKTVAKLADAKAAAGEMLGDDPGVAAQAGRDLRVAGLEKDLKEQGDLIKAAEARVQETRIALAGDAAARMIDPLARIKKQYDDQAASARNSARAAAKSGGEVTDALTRQLAAIERNRAAAVKAEQDKQKAAGETARQYGREVTSSQASAIARAAGLQVNSADRSTARQKQLYDTWAKAGKPAENPVAKPGTSAHERGNALDIQFEAGVTAKKIKDAFAAEGVRLTKVFAETGHWHIEWSKTAAQRSASADAAKDTRDLAKANRELDSDLTDVVAKFDPARAAADEYASSLKKIAALRGAGKITADQAGDYTLALLKDQQEKAATQRIASFKTMFGEVEDPFAAGNASWRVEQDEQINAWTVEQDRRQQVQQDGVRTVAGLYRNLMSGGTRSIFDSFKEMGMNAIADLAAKWTLSQIGKLSGSGGILGSLASLVTGTSKAVATTAGAAARTTGPPAYATGTEYASGGAAIVGEFGKELVNLPRGSRVTPAAETRRMLAGNDNRPATVNHFHLDSPVVTQDLLDQMNAIGSGAAVRGAAGGAAMGMAENKASAARKLGRRW